MSDVYATLGQIIGDELGTAPVRLAAATELADIPGWDSATLAGVLLGIEAIYGVVATREQIAGLDTGADLAALCVKPG